MINLCESVRHWALQGEGAPPDSLLRHVAGCPACRGALALTLGELGGAPPGDLVGCAACAADLDPYLELERAEGALAAARRYPQVWWHLWACADCAETARLTRALLDAEAAGALPWPPLRDAGPAAVIALARAYLHQLFAPQALLGPAWDDDEAGQVIAEQDLPGGRLALAARQNAAGQWELLAQTAPPARGAVTLTMGAERASAALGPSGGAAFGPFDPARLAAADGPDLIVELDLA